MRRFRWRIALPDFFNEHPPRFPLEFEYSKGVFDRGLVMSQIGVDEPPIDELVKPRHLLAEFGLHVRSEPGLHLGDDLLCAQELVATRIEILSAKGFSGLADKPDRAVIEHQVKLLLRRGENRVSKIFFRGAVSHDFSTGESIRLRVPRRDDGKVFFV